MVGQGGRGGPLGVELAGQRLAGEAICEVKVGSKGKRLARARVRRHVEADGVLPAADEWQGG